MNLIYLRVQQKKSRKTNKDVLEARFYLEYKILPKEDGVGNYS